MLKKKLGISLLEKNTKIIPGKTTNIQKSYPPNYMNLNKNIASQCKNVSANRDDRSILSQRENSLHSQNSHKTHKGQIKIDL